MTKNARTEVPPFLQRRAKPAPTPIHRPHIATPEAKAARARKLDAWTSGKRKTPA